MIRTVARTIFDSLTSFFEKRIKTSKPIPINGVLNKQHIDIYQRGMSVPNSTSHPYPLTKEKLIDIPD